MTEPQTEPGRALVKVAPEMAELVLAIEEEAARRASDAQVARKDALRIEETYARFLAALDAVRMTEAERAAIYNAALDWNGAVQDPAPQPAPLDERKSDGLRLHDDARRDLVPRSPEDVVLALARESLAHRDEYASKGYVMEPMPFEVEVRARLAEPPSTPEPETGR